MQLLVKSVRGFGMVLLVLFSSACMKNSSFIKATDEQPDGLAAILSENPNSRCVNVFYDMSPEPDHKLGRVYALTLLNLLGHFPEFQQIVGPIELYRKNDIEKCQATFYIGSYYDNALPSDFIQDFNNTSRQVVWMGYNFWHLGEQFHTDFGYNDFSFTTLDYAHLNAGKPSFFSDIIYKGETFHKYNQWNAANPAVLDAPFEMVKLLSKISDNSEILALAKQSKTDEIIPWALRAKNKYFITEIPFSFQHEADRYFVFADLLFDILKVAPKNQRHALLRLEDIHPLVELSLVDEAMEILKRYNITPHISIVPVFRDPFYTVNRSDNRVEIPMEEVPQFAAKIQQYADEGSVFIWHGVTHQYNDIKNPFTGASGSDYEFWNSITRSPIAEDSADYVLDRLDKGFSSLKKFGIAPKIWLTPHYHASALDNIIFGQVFSWVVSRGVYSDFIIGGVRALHAEKPLYFSLNNSEVTSQNRKDYLSGLRVSSKPGAYEFSQLYPYEIYGDIYGQNVIPENLGNVQPFLSVEVLATRTVDTILADARRNLVLRDVWASVFYHPFLLDPSWNQSNAVTGPKDLERLVSGLKALGYNFINLNDFSNSNVITKAKPRIELEELR